MNITLAGNECGLPPKTIRYYEEIGLVSPERRANGYRDYGANEIHKLRFLARARGLGFSIGECRQLLALYADKHRASSDVKAMANARIDAIDQKIAELESLKLMLRHLAEHCHGDNRPDCPILEGLAGKEPLEGQADISR
ncbi:MAG: Cu(I)-responsive transcriptional regulator [Nitratireductor sp.]